MGSAFFDASASAFIMPELMERVTRINGNDNSSTSSSSSSSSSSHVGPTKSTVGMTPVADMRKSHPITFR